MYNPIHRKLPTLVRFPSPATITTKSRRRRTQNRTPDTHFLSHEQTPIIIRSFSRIRQRSVRRMHFHKLISRRITVSDVRMQNSG
ncbi:hypothetical protein Hanom_Chr13g01182581 [Helianthus anomalus]